MGKKSSPNRIKQKSKFFLLRVRYHVVAFSLACVAFGMAVGLVNTVVMNSAAHFCANSISCINDISGSYKTQNEGVFMGQTVAVPEYIADSPNGSKVLGDATGSDKHIFIDLSNQRLYAFEGNKLVYNFLVSTGKWNHTPTGNFKIWIKLRYTSMIGGNASIGTYYNLPNVPYTMYLYNEDHPKYEGYGIHGTYWHSNFGHPMSHGCINMKTEEAAQLYAWAHPETKGYVTYSTDSDQGTPVTIYGTTPNQ